MKKSKNLIITGAAGRMGQQIIKLLPHFPQFQLIAAIVAPDSKNLGIPLNKLIDGNCPNINFSSANDADWQNADVIIDFSTPESSLTYLDIAKRYNASFLTGTTGWSAEQELLFKEYSSFIPIVKSSNLSLVVNLLTSFIKQAAAFLPAEQFDIEIIEAHHRNKVDAPSGTAILLANAACEGREIDLKSNQISDERFTNTKKRETGSIGFASVRGGSIYGIHEVMFIGDDEIVSFKHNANNRKIFAQGALVAANWLTQQGPGLYNMQDVLDITK